MGAIVKQLDECLQAAQKGDLVRVQVLASRLGAGYGYTRLNAMGLVPLLGMRASPEEAVELIEAAKATLLEDIWTS